MGSNVQVLYAVVWSAPLKLDHIFTAFILYLKIKSQLHNYAEKFSKQS